MEGDFDLVTLDLDNYGRVWVEAVNMLTDYAHIDVDTIHESVKTYNTNAKDWDMQDMNWLQELFDN